MVPRRVRAVEEARAVADAVPEATVELGKAADANIVKAGPCLVKRQISGPCFVKRQISVG